MDDRLNQSIKTLVTELEKIRDEHIFGLKAANRGIEALQNICKHSWKVHDFYKKCEFCGLISKD